ncbi:MAG: DUF2892 domain-containing protein [Bacteroidales bacterium]|nr:DUF2892 domain-containing protein [Bacteroidales bacterium]
MKKNMGSADKVIRLLIAAVIILLYILNVVSGVLGYILLAFAFIFIVTSLVSFCPLYTIFGIKTCKK